MKIFIFVVCLLLTQLTKAHESSEPKDGNDLMIEKILEGLSSVKSSKCQSDINQTVNAFYERKPWAVASKNF